MFWIANHCLPLTRTIFKKAFSCNIPVGIIFLRGSENIIDENNFRFQKNKKAQIEYRTILYPKDFASFALFYQAAKYEFYLYSPKFINAE